MKIIRFQNWGIRLQVWVKGKLCSGRVRPTAEKFIDSLNPDGDDWRKAWMLRIINVRIMKWKKAANFSMCPFLIIV